MMTANDVPKLLILSHLLSRRTSEEINLACVGFAIFPHVTVQITATVLAASRHPVTEEAEW